MSAGESGEENSHFPGEDEQDEEEGEEDNLYCIPEDGEDTEGKIDAGKSFVNKESIGNSESK